MRKLKCQKVQFEKIMCWKVLFGKLNISEKLLCRKLKCRNFNMYGKLNCSHLAENKIMEKWCERKSSWCWSFSKHWNISRSSYWYLIYQPLKISSSHQSTTKHYHESDLVLCTSRASLKNGSSCFTNIEWGSSDSDEFHIGQV